MSINKKRERLKRLKISRYEYGILIFPIICGVFTGLHLLYIIPILGLLLVTIISIVKKFLIVRWLEIISSFFITHIILEIFSFNYSVYTTIISLLLFAFFFYYYNLWSVIKNYAKGKRNAFGEVRNLVRKRYLKRIRKMKKKESLREMFK